MERQFYPEEIILNDDTGNRQVYISIAKWQNMVFQTSILTSGFSLQASEYAACADTFFS